MIDIYQSREIAKLILLQRTELVGPKLKKIRKLFGRYFFTNFAAKYFVKPEIVIEKYLKLMELEIESIQNFINFLHASCERLQELKSLAVIYNMFKILVFTSTTTKIN